MSGVRLVQGPGFSNYQETIVANSANLDFGDYVVLDTNGFLARAAAGQKVQGIYCEQFKTIASDNQTVGLVKSKWQPMTDDMVFELTADQACTQTDIGAYADIKLVSNAFQLDLPAGNTGQFEVIDFDPNRDGSTTVVRVVCAEPEQLAFAQS